MPVVPFPAHKHRKIVAAIADHMAEQPTPEQAEEVLCAHLRVQWDHGQFRGLDPGENSRDVLAFANAVRALLSADQVAILDRAVASVTGSSRRSMPALQASRRREPALHVEITLPRARVIPFPSFRGTRYIEDLVSSMLRVDRPKGEGLLNREKQVITEDLVGAGADPEAVERAIRSIEAAVRGELWRRVLLP